MFSNTLNIYMCIIKPLSSHPELEEHKKFSFPSKVGMLGMRILSAFTVGNRSEFIDNTVKPVFVINHCTSISIILH